MVSGFAPRGNFNNRDYYNIEKKGLKENFEKPIVRKNYFFQILLQYIKKGLKDNFAKYIVRGNLFSFF